MYQNTYIYYLFVSPRLFEIITIVTDIGIKNNIVIWQVAIEMIELNVLSF